MIMPNKGKILKYSQKQISHEMVLKINPVSKPRMTHADRWKSRPVVMKYWNYRDEVFYGALAQGYRPSYELSMDFVLPMPKSWSKKKQEEMNNTPHKNTPDIDNLAKGILDALFEEDKEVYKIVVTKTWGKQGSITIKNLR
tara:strand:- start:5988 stop:6410 length:423 start_codon:yes stop_codon:yes gene_type:complete